MEVKIKYKYILFDLDGTLTDPKVGITKSVEFALNKMGISDVKLSELTKFIGPPLQGSFIQYYKFNKDEADLAIQFYREYFKDKGIFENEIYSGIKELLKKLKDNGSVLALATSKPTVYAEKIIEYFKLEEYFSFIAGSNLDNTRSEKTEVIEFALKNLDINQKETVLMIGDREHDIIGANNHGIDSIGVEYGYGSREELEKASATYIVRTVEDLAMLLE